MDIAMVTNFRTKFAVTGFVWTIATRLIVMEGVWVVGQQNADIVGALQLRGVAKATAFGVLIRATWQIPLNRSCAAATGISFPTLRIAVLPM